MRGMLCEYMIFVPVHRRASGQDLMYNKCMDRPPCIRYGTRIIVRYCTMVDTYSSRGLSMIKSMLGTKKSRVTISTVSSSPGRRRLSGTNGPGEWGTWPSG